jgi:hypothetical protein
VAREVHVTGTEMFEYAQLDPDRWKILDGCRAYCSERGFGVIESHDGDTEFTIVFGDPERHWWRLWRRDEIKVGRDAFADGRVSAVVLPDLPMDFTRNSRFGSPYGREACLVLAPKPDCHADNEHLSRSLAIQAVCREHGITDLVHFTRARHINSILEYGLLSRTAVTQLPSGQMPTVNDLQRIDGQCGSISVSVSFPNYKMFYKYRMLNSNIKWVVLTLSAKILWELDCAFCPRNAATYEMTHITLAERKSCDSFVRMFGNVGDKPRQQLCVLPSYTTDPQAEVLVMETIPPSMIKSVCFSCQQNLDAWCNKYGGVPRNYVFQVKPYLFAPRVDYDHWR